MAWRRRPGPDRVPDSGSATVWVAALLLPVVTAAVLAVGATTAVGARHAAQLAADLAALAGAGRIGVSPGDICPAAQRSAASNGAVVTRCDVVPGGVRTGDVRVEVTRTARWGGFDLVARARAHAARIPPGDPVPPSAASDASGPAVWQHDPRGTAGVGHYLHVTARRSVRRRDVRGTGRPTWT